MILKLEKSTRINFDSAKSETWFYVYKDAEIIYATCDESKAEKAFLALQSFLKDHSTHPLNETLREIEL